MLRSVDRTGADERTHVSGSNMVALAVSPDGRWIAFVDDYDVWVAPLMATGKSVSLGKGTKGIPVRKLSARAGDFLA
ncbi:MAG: hypothetical protein GWN79_11220, partial [Actinobacteria bacterium]|nr:hypothetical protein [Actinomycetota bacterium]NIU19618.1 hypothetical protein [Actinomycetota bacterium]